MTTLNIVDEMAVQIGGYVLNLSHISAVGKPIANYTEDAFYFRVYLRSGTDFITDTFTTKEEANHEFSDLLMQLHWAYPEEVDDDEEVQAPVENLLVNSKMGDLVLLRDSESIAVFMITKLDLNDPLGQFSAVCIVSDPDPEGWQQGMSSHAFTQVGFKPSN